MKVLVTAASRHGSTREIAEAVGRRLAEEGIEADVLEPDVVGSVAEYDAVVLGSAVYMGRWLEPAKRLATENAPVLRRVPVWLFSSGPTGDPLMPKDDPVDAGPLLAATGAREHRVFGGVIDRRRLALTEKAIVTMVRARDGDYRQWQEIDEWTAQIAKAVAARPVA